jgi:hypothetical protein
LAKQEQVWFWLKSDFSTEKIPKISFFKGARSAESFFNAV